MQRHKFISIFTLFVLSILAPIVNAVDRVNISSAKIESNNDTLYGSVSADGRFVAFSSIASNLVAGDTNNKYDIFVHDHHTGITERVSVASDGSQANDSSFSVSISGDGRFVAFSSHADNLVKGDNKDTGDIFVHDRHTQITEIVSVASDGTKSNSFYTHEPSISFNGRFVAFQSRADNLVENDTNDTYDIFVHDRKLDTTKRVSVSSNGAQASNKYYQPISEDPSISSNGRYIAFSSFADNLVPGDTNGSNSVPGEDIFVHDRLTGLTERVSVTSDGSQGCSQFPAAISGNGRFVTFTSPCELTAGDKNNIRGIDIDSYDVFVHDRNTGETERIDLDSNGASGYRASVRPSISNDGRLVSYTAFTNYFYSDRPKDFDIFLHDRTSKITQRMSVASDGEQGNNYSSRSKISGNGRFLMFTSYASNLVKNDRNQQRDLFLSSVNLPKRINNFSVVVSPSSGVVEVGNKIRFLAKFTNHTNRVLTNCRARIRNQTAQGRRLYKFYTWLVNDPNPKANTPVDILPGETSLMRLVVTPLDSVQEVLKFDYSCDKQKAYTIPFENSVFINAKTSPLIAEDFIQLKNFNNKTELEIDRQNNKFWSSYSVKVINTGTEHASVSLTTKNRGKRRLCETTGIDVFQCKRPVSLKAQVSLNPGETKHVRVFVHTDYAIAQKPSVNRIFVEARDQAGDLVAKNSIAVYTKN